MRVLIVNTSERTGGAAVAANRLMKALNNNGVKAKMLVRDKETDALTVVAVAHDILDDDVLRPAVLRRDTEINAVAAGFYHVQIQYLKILGTQNADAMAPFRLFIFRRMVVRLAHLHRGALPFAAQRHVLDVPQP